MNLSEKIARWGLTEVGFGCSYCYDTRFADEGPVIAWTGAASRKGYVMLWPIDNDAIWAPTLDIALERLSVLAL